MMSRELRNPLNGMLGPLALLDQSDIPARLKRLVEQAYQSGHSMLQMLSACSTTADPGRAVPTCAVIRSG